MTTQNPDRASHFPAIEKKHGRPVAHWLGVLKALGAKKYAEQVAHLREEHGFSQTHANALVLYSRGSTSSRRFASFDEYLASHDATKQNTMRAIFGAIQRAHPKLELVIAWNQPMLKHGDAYVFGASVQKQHILIAPFDASVLDQLRPRLADYEVNKKTVRVPVDWKVDAKLLRDMIAAQLATLDD